MKEESDEYLVNRFLRKREESSFRILFERHSPSLYLLAIRLLAGKKSDAEDVLQETWMRATRNLDVFRWQSSLRTWLSGIVINCCRESIRNQETNSPDAIEQSHAVGNVQQSIQLETLIRQLPNGCREVFILHDMEGYTHNEICSLLGIHSGTSKSQLFEARKKLRYWWNGKQETGDQK
ncbi:RNA polymerase sigma factor [bacterium]|nr:RNA polymerase sigma factor [bacterium]